MTISSLLYSTILLVLYRSSEGFAFPTVPHHTLSFSAKPTSTWAITNAGKSCRAPTTALAAAKKRRRRRADGKKITESSSMDTDAISTGSDSDSYSDQLDADELPDFDLGDKEQLPELFKSDSTESKTEKKAVVDNMAAMDDNELPQSFMSTDDPAMMEAMRGTQQGKSFASPKDLIKSRDRELEAKFEFDEVKKPLPRPGQKKMTTDMDMTMETPTPTMGKKRARDEARKAAAMETAAKETTNDGGFGIPELLSKLPFFPKVKKDKDGNYDPLNLLEQGTWFCIYSLVAWEIYINSPLFERAAPTIPVVY